ncbi:E3 ubiquitin-protein ligase ATL6-like [Macadamia integrifolia]|uniref:E3 ubiquitin-protein ligase ATL6-like n=1 Tax=Macadamia integrifolia TaxID=60698 RepID=UPI001C4F2437|nr:E3 ubiquitin-protein ligase ATL6-like [Macadamia integrifolia]
MKNQLKQKQSHRSILDLFVPYPGTQYGLTYIYLFLMFQSLPSAAAQNTTQSPHSDPYSFSDYVFNPSTAGVLVVIIVAFFFLSFLSICIGQRSDTNNDERGVSRRGNRGLDPAVIDSFPTFAYSYVKGHKLGKGALECAVCLTEFEDEDTLRLLPKCDHVFHPECIDAWLSKRTTCPVCRANFAAVSGETSPISVHDTEVHSDGEIPSSELQGSENQQLFINVGPSPQAAAVAVAPSPSPEVIDRIPMQNRPARTKPPRPTFTGRFPRSHSTGHSVVQPGDDVERFTLRLPEDVRKQIMNMRHLNRTRSMVLFPRVGSSRKGNRTTGEGSSRGGKSMRGVIWEKPEGWIFSMTPPFFMRASPSRSAKGDALVTPRPKPLRLPLRVNMKADGTGPSLTRPPV